MIYPSVSLNLLQLFDHGFESFTVCIRQSVAVRSKMLLNHFPAFGPLLGIGFKSSNLIDLIVQQSRVIVFDLLWRAPFRKIVTLPMNKLWPVLSDQPRASFNRPLIVWMVDVFTLVGAPCAVSSGRHHPCINHPPHFIGSVKIVTVLHCLKVRLNKGFSVRPKARKLVLKDVLSFRNSTRLYLISRGSGRKPNPIPVSNRLVVLATGPSFFQRRPRAKCGPKTRSSVKVKKVIFHHFKMSTYHLLIKWRSFSLRGLGAEQKECADE